MADITHIISGAVASAPTAEGYRVSLEGFTPHGNGVLGVVLNPHNYSEGGILLDATRRDHLALRVVKVGPGSRQNGVRCPIDAAPGDVVLFRDGVGEEIDFNGQQYLMLQAHHIIGRWQGEGA